MTAAGHLHAVIFPSLVGSDIEQVVKNGNYYNRYDGCGSIRFDYK